MRARSEAVGGPEAEGAGSGGGAKVCTIQLCCTANRNSFEFLDLQLYVYPPSGLKNEFTRIPGAGFRVLRSKDEYGLFTTEQTHAGGRKKYWPRAKLLGGCAFLS